jgi:transposase
MGITRRKFSKEFKVEAVRLVQDRGVTISQAARDLDVGETVLRRWVRELTTDPVDAFPGLGKMKPEQEEIARLQKEVAKLKMERDILKKPQRTSPRSRCEVRLHRETSGYVAHESLMCDARCVAQWLLCLVDQAEEQT